MAKQWKTFPWNRHLWRSTAKFADSVLPSWPRRGRTSVTPCAALAEHGVWMPAPMPASKMPHSCGEACLPVRRCIPVALCTASSKPIFILYLNPPCSANAAHGVTEVQPLRGYARRRIRQVLPLPMSAPPANRLCPASYPPSASFCCKVRHLCINGSPHPRHINPVLKRLMSCFKGFNRVKNTKNIAIFGSV